LFDRFLFISRGTSTGDFPQSGWIRNDMTTEIDFLWQRAKIMWKSGTPTVSNPLGVIYCESSHTGQQCESISVGSQADNSGVSLASRTLHDHLNCSLPEICGRSALSFPSMPMNFRPCGRIMLGTGVRYRITSFYFGLHPNSVLNRFSPVECFICTV
jgi:hypothetical protein